MSPKLQQSKDSITQYLKDSYPGMDFYVTISDKNEREYASFGVERLKRKHDAFLDEEMEDKEGEDEDMEAEGQMELEEGEES
jgi:hypothetical protein